MHFKIFSGHKPPNFKMWKDFTYIFDKKVLGIPANVDFLGVTDEVLSEYHSLFLLKEFFKNNGVKEGLITICQHRRFVLNSKIGIAAANQPFARIINDHAAANLNTNLTLPVKGGFLVATPYFFNVPLTHQYFLHHQIRDLLRFSSDILDANLMSPDEINNFLTQNYFLPAPSCGTYPVDIFIEIMDFLQKCTISFHSSGYKKRDGYQGRVTSFLLERLNSYALVRAMKIKGYDFMDYTGFTTLVNDGNIVRGG